MDDLISRKAAIDGAVTIQLFDRDIPVVPVQHIKNLPSAQPDPSQVERDIATIIENEQDMRVMLQPERKRGEWIYGEHDVAMCDGYFCDKCGFFVPWDYQHKSIDFIKDYNFCPNCGADMRGET